MSIEIILDGKYKKCTAGWTSLETDANVGDVRMLEGILHYAAYSHFVAKFWFSGGTASTIVWCPVKSDDLLGMIEQNIRSKGSIYQAFKDAEVPF